MRNLRVGLIGCGVIGGFVLDGVIAGKVDNIDLVVIAEIVERPQQMKKAKDHGIDWITDAQAVLNLDLDVVIEAASHEALESYGEEILRAGIDLIPVSVGALVDSEFLQRLWNAAVEGGSKLHIPSGGIGGLDALQAVINTNVDEVSMTTRKPPLAWKGVSYVEQMNLDLENMVEPTLLYDGPARECVKKFPQSINIAAALSLAGIGFDATHIRIMADPTVQHNTHEIQCKGDAGRFTMTLENVPVPANPKTTYQACLSVLATLKNIRSSYRVGT